MEDWLGKALELFPELEGEFERTDLSPIALWIELYFALVTAYREEPIDDDFIGRVFDFAAWCFEQPQTGSAETDLSSAVAVCLIEGLPLDERISADLYRWMSVESFDGFANLFRYHLSEEQYRAFREVFMEKKRTFKGPSRL